jgi:hypothetical protein
VRAMARRHPWKSIEPLTSSGNCNGVRTLASVAVILGSRLAWRTKGASRRACRYSPRTYGFGG